MSPPSAKGLKSTGSRISEDPGRITYLNATLHSCSYTELTESSVARSTDLNGWIVRGRTP
jgi:hypothetical protein